MPGLSSGMFRKMHGRLSRVYNCERDLSRDSVDANSGTIGHELCKKTAFLKFGAKTFWHRSCFLQ